MTKSKTKKINFPYNEQTLEIQKENEMRYMYDALVKKSKSKFCSIFTFADKFIIDFLWLDFEDISDETRSRMEYELLAENTLKVDLYDQKVELLCTERLEPFHLFLQAPVISTARIGKEKITQDDSFKLFLESAHAGVPVRTEICLDRVLSYSTFPGQIVSVKGSNPTSKLFRMNALRAPSPLAAFPLSYSEHGITVFSACGPFATQHFLMNLQPLEFLLNQVKDKKPDFLILNGPFVDSRQLEQNGGLIQLQGTEYSVDQWFRLQIDMIMETCNFTDTTVLIVPSHTDVHHPFCVYPQPRYELKHESLGKV